MLEKVATSHEVHYEINAVLILENILRADHELVVRLR